MTKIEKAKRVSQVLDELYPNPPIPLLHENAFTLCIAVLLSAQATGKSVNLVTPELFRRAPTPEAMVKLGPEKILSIIKTVGLAPTKSRNVWNLCRLLLEKQGGKIPNSFEELEALPGVGHKTASVVMSQGFGFPAFPVDTHIHRLAERWGLSNGTTVEQTEKDLKKLFPEDQWNKLHLQIIYYGREYCPARGHDLERCVLCRELAAKTRRVKTEKVKKVPAKR